MTQEGADRKLCMCMCVYVYSINKHNTCMYVCIYIYIMYNIYTHIHTYGREPTGNSGSMVKGQVVKGH